MGVTVRYLPVLYNMHGTENSFSWITLILDKGKLAKDKVFRPMYNVHGVDNSLC